MSIRSFAAPTAPISCAAASVQPLDPSLDLRAERLRERTDVLNQGIEIDRSHDTVGTERQHDEVVSA
jgi:hypothetical protein